MRYLLISAGLTLAWAQALRCGSDDFRAQEEVQNPGLSLLREELEQAAARWIASQGHLRAQNSCPESEYIIPVVVHIIHSGAGQSDSLPLSRVLFQMEQLFNDYRKRPYTKGYSSGVDTRIEFSLATKDPAGNPHPGVTYTRFSDAGLSEATVYMSGSLANASTLKSNVSWPRNKYLNIWVIRRICSSSSSCPTGGDILGFATFPNNISDTDEGVVVAAFVFGNSGGGQTTTHENGHYLNLLHTFQGGCGGTTNSNCGTGGDRVCDTPPTGVSTGNYGAARRQNTCGENISAIGGDRPDQVRNYMDYLDDPSLDIFTEGQRARMAAALNSATDRQQWQSANLQATGAGPWGRVRADFALNGCEQPPCYACPGQQLTFTSYSWGKPHQFQWEIRQGTTVVASSTSGPCATLSAPSTPGTYDVRLSVTNQVGTDDTLYTGFLIVRDPSQAASLPFSEGFEATTFPPTGWVRINPDFATGNSKLSWERYSSTGRGSFGASNAMIRLRNFNYPNRTQRDHLITPLITIPATAQNPGIEFDVYYRALYWENSSSSPANIGYLYGDTLAVYISSDCGSTWTRLYYVGGEELDVTGTAVQVVGRNPSSADQAVPPTGSNTAWRHEAIPIPPAFVGQTVLIRFENITEMGNHLYIDSIQVRENVSTSQPMASSTPTIVLLPNPASSEAFLWVKGAAQGMLQYRLLSLTGQELAAGQEPLTGEDKRVSLPIGHLPAGLYLVEASLGGKREIWRLAKE